jgi:pimeloyl-ACP methyl ester carboxylesterase
VSEVQLHIEEYGTNEPTIVLMHGFAGSARNFRPQSRFLKEKYRVFLFDLRGHARSEAPREDAEYAPECFVDDVDRVVRSTGSDRVVLGGISMGAGIALRYALARPEKIRALTLFSFPASYERTESWAHSFADAIETRGIEAAGAEFVWGGGRYDEGSAKWIRQGFVEHQPHALASILRQVLAVQPRAKDLASELAAVAFPVLLVTGEEDANAIEQTNDLARLVPAATSVSIAGAGHVVNLQKTESFNGALGDFLRRIEA